MINVCSLANSILVKSFEEGVLITPVKLSYIIYDIYLYYLTNYGKEMFYEKFIMTEKGLILPSIEFKFGCYKNDVIRTFSRDAKGEVDIVIGCGFEDVLEYIWNKDKNKFDEDIIKSVPEFKIYETINLKDILEKEIVSQEKKLIKLKEFHNKL